MFVCVWCKWRWLWSVRIGQRAPASPAPAQPPPLGVRAWIVTIPDQTGHPHPHITHRSHKPRGGPGEKGGSWETNISQREVVLWKSPFKSADAERPWQPITTQRVRVEKEEKRTVCLKISLQSPRSAGTPERLQCSITARTPAQTHPLGLLRSRVLERARARACVCVRAHI